MSEIVARSKLAKVLNVPIPVLDGVTLATQCCRNFTLIALCMRRNIVLATAFFICRHSILESSAVLASLLPFVVTMVSGKVVSSCCCLSEFCKTFDKVFRFPSKPDQVAMADQVSRKTDKDGDFTQHCGISVLVI